MTVELRSGELVVYCGGGAICVCCKAPIVKGPAVQLSRYSARLRHTTCMPKQDQRTGMGGKSRKGKRILPERNYD